MATIQTIHKPTRARGLDTSGNNNHAQIYSGRGLYFDGVTDYLQVDAGTHVTFIDWSEQSSASDRAWSIAFWIKLAADESGTKRITGNAGSNSSYIAITGAEKLTIYSLDDAAWQTWDPALELNTWYRAVIVYDGSTKYTGYLNGESLGDKTITEPTSARGDLQFDRIGDDNGSHNFNGWLSDFQAWTGAWTAADAEYDYLNPEQLALNRGGTSLTNSNLKLWYPMNDGHRGNQSFILDASNTGGTKNNATTAFYGDELVENESFDTADDWTAQSGWTVSGNGVATVDSSAAGTTNLTSTGMAVVVGRTYAAEMYVDSSSGSGIRFDLGGVSGGSYLNTTGLIEATIVATSTAGFSITASGSDTTSQISRVSVKEIGIATGWTDADQQLDIPQTALQSYNQLAYFDERSSEITIADTNDLSFTNDSTDSPFSLSAWIYVNGPTISYGHFIMHKGGYSSYHKWEYTFFVNTARNVTFTCHDGATADSARNDTVYAGRRTDDAPIEFGRWYHVVATYDGGDDPQDDAKLYINGQEGSHASYTGGSYAFMKNQSIGSYIGKKGASGSYGDEGCQNETSVWDKELSSAEVQEIYNEGLALDCTTHSASANLVGYWRNNGIAQWDDLSSNSNNGAITGVIETMLITAGVDSSRDSQGFLMNRQRTTNSLNQTSETSNTFGADLGETSTFAAGAAFSITVWAKPTDITDNKIMGDTGTDYIAFKDTNELQIEANNVQDDFTINAPSSWTVDEWVHIGIVRNTSNLITTYINGVAQSDTETVDEAFDYRYIGGVSDSKFRGELDDVCIYSDELGAAEVLRNYNAGKRSHR